MKAGRKIKFALITKGIVDGITQLSKMQSALFGLRVNLTSHLGRSSLSRSFGYASADDRPSCFASFTLIPESFMQYAG